MPISQGGAGGLPGMNLKAWALVRPDGTLIKSMNVTSINKGAAGSYALNFTAAMASTNYVTKWIAMGSINTGIAATSCNAHTRNTASCLIEVAQGGIGNDLGGLFEIYE